MKGKGEGSFWVLLWLLVYLNPSVLFWLCNPLVPRCQVTSSPFLSRMHSLQNRAIYFFFFLRFSGERESHGTGWAPLPSRVARACLRSPDKRKKKK